MKSFKKMILIGTAVLALASLSVTALAANAAATPAEAAAQVTGRTVESVTDEHTANDKTYGSIAADAGKLDDFKAAMLEARKAQLASRVADGTMTQERADEIIAAMQENQANCDGTGSARIGRAYGAGFGGQRSGNGCGYGCGGACVAG